MSALRQPDSFNNYYPQASTPEVKEERSAKKIRDKSAKVVVHRTFPRSNKLPSHLKTLSLLQKGSFGLAIASMAASVGLYLSTVQIPKLWSQEYQHLEDLQRQERQLISINETIKYQIAREASLDKELAIATPESAVFINPAPVKLKKAADNDGDRQQEIALKYGSLGY